MNIKLLKMPRLDEISRGEALEMLKCRRTYEEVSHIFNCHKTTICRLWKRYLATGSIRDRKRSGKPRKLTPCTKALIIIEHQIAPSTTIVETAHKYHVSCRTVLRLLRESGIKKPRRQQELSNSKS